MFWFFIVDIILNFAAGWAYIGKGGTYTKTINNKTKGLNWLLHALIVTAFVWLIWFSV